MRSPWASWRRSGRERCVAVVPDDVARPRKAGGGRRERCGFRGVDGRLGLPRPRRGCRHRDELVARAQLVVTVRKPSPEVLAGRRPGQALATGGPIGLTLNHPGSTGGSELAVKPPGSVQAAFLMAG